MVESKLESLLQKLLSKKVRTLAASTLIAGSVAFASPAAAQPEDSPILDSSELCGSAKDCFMEGKKLYESGELEGAGRYFKESHRLASPDKKPALLYNIALVYFNSGHPELAKNYFELFLGENTGEVDRDKVEATLPRLGLWARGRKSYADGNYQEAIEYLIKAYQDNSSGAYNQINKDIARSYERMGNFERAIFYYDNYLNEGDEEIRDRGEIVMKVVSLRRQVEGQVSSTDDSAIDSTLEDNPEESSLGWASRNKGVLISAGIGAALAGAGGINWQLANSKFNDLESTCGQTTDGCPENDIDGLETRYRLSQGLFVGGGIAIGTALVLLGIDYFSDKDKQRTESENPFNIDPYSFNWRVRF